MDKKSEEEKPMPAAANMTAVPLPPPRVIQGQQDEKRNAKAADGAELSDTSVARMPAHAVREPADAFAGQTNAAAAAAATSGEGKSSGIASASTGAASTSRTIDESLPGAYSVNPFGSRDSSDSSDDSEDDEERQLEQHTEPPTRVDHAVDTPIAATLVVDDSSNRNSADSVSRAPFVEGGQTSNISVQEEFPMVEARKEHSAKKRQIFVGGIFCISAMIIASLIWALIAVNKSKNDNNDSDTPPESSLTQLQEIKQRGYLKCTQHFGKYYGNLTGPLNTTSDFNNQLCKAVAAAIFNDKEKLEFVPYTAANRFQLVADGDADLHAMASMTMERQIQDPSTGTPFHFSSPYYFMSIRFAGIPQFVQCLDDLNPTGPICSNLKVCCASKTTYYAGLVNLLSERRVVPVKLLTDVRLLFANSTCNAVVSGEHNLAERFFREAGYNGSEYVIGNRILQNEHTRLVTRSNDAQWSDFVNAVMLSLQAAEPYNISKMNAHELPETLLFGDEYKGMFRNAVAAVGNFGDMYEETMKSLVARGRLNRVNDGTSGLQYSESFGDISTSRNEERPLGKSFRRILERGFLRCGVRVNRPGFAVELNQTEDRQEFGMMEGMEIDYCKAIAASLFEGDADKVEFVPIPPQNLSSGFETLSEGLVDILAGTVWSLENDVWQPDTRQGFSLSLPYFFGSDDGDLCLATRQDDGDLEALVYWTVSALVYAEEQNITQGSPNEMPEVYLFGPEFKRLFRDAVWAVGNYGEIYQRNVELHIPRKGRNMPNDNGPRFHLPQDLADSIESKQ